MAHLGGCPSLRLLLELCQRTPQVLTPHTLVCHGEILVSYIAYMYAVRNIQGDVSIYAPGEMCALANAGGSMHRCTCIDRKNARSPPISKRF